jgi:2-desacetyl-2-hydroxyethyl bacteriochlorophyllide A dehydrogenase
MPSLNIEEGRPGNDPGIRWSERGVGMKREKMEAIVWLGKDSIDIQTVPIPQPKQNEVLIRIHSTGICGSDKGIIGGTHLRARAPLILGHEFMGIVEEVNIEDSSLKRGDRVVVEPLLACGKCHQCIRGLDHICENLNLIGVDRDGAFTEYVRVPVQRVYPLPESISNDEAALIEPLAVAVHAVSLSNPKPDDVVVILGGGPIGLLIAQVIRSYCVKKVYICEHDPYRLQIARSLGIDTIDCAKEQAIEMIDDLTGNRGADITFDAAGVPGTAEQVIPITGIRGRIVIVAIHKKAASVTFQKLSYKEQIILGSCIYAKGDFKEAIDLLANKRIDVERLITHRFTMSKGLEAFELVLSGKNFCKVIVKQNHE